MCVGGDEVEFSDPFRTRESGEFPYKLNSVHTLRALTCIFSIMGLSECISTYVDEKIST